MAKSKIEWCDCTINPVVGCSKCSPACDHCYAERQAARLVHMPQTAAKYAGVVDEHGKWTGIINGLDVPCGKRILRQGELDLSCFDKLPKKPQRIFVGSMTDVFHENVSDLDLGAIFARIEREARHTFMVLTKRPVRMRAYFASRSATRIPNLWLGVTVCNQQEADTKIPVLLKTPAAKRFVSVEPMLGAVDLQAVRFIHSEGFFGDALQWHHLPHCRRDELQDGAVYPALDWVICGGETGPKARPMHPDWVRGLRDQCAAAGTPFFFKGWGEFSPSEIEHTASGAVNKTGGKFHYIFDKTCNGNMRKLGKKHRLLDGVEYSEVPQ